MGVIMNLEAAWTVKGFVANRADMLSWNPRWCPSRRSIVVSRALRIVEWWGRT
jgi:hypothetical protein